MVFIINKNYSSHDKDDTNDSDGVTTTTTNITLTLLYLEQTTSYFMWML